MGSLEHLYVIINHIWESLQEENFWQYNTLAPWFRDERKALVENAHQKFALLFPGGALGVGVSVGFGHHPDQLPLCRVRFGPGLQHADHFLLLPSLPVLLDQTALGYTLRVIQHHWLNRGLGVWWGGTFRFMKKTSFQWRAEELHTRCED